MHVLVAGGTGFIGTALCEELAARGHDVSALARDPSDADLPGSVDRAAADITDETATRDAVNGHDAVVNLVALSPLFQPSGGNEAHDRVHRAGTANLVAAAEAHDVPRFVQMSALGADPDGPTAYIRAKGAAETVVREADLDWVIVRPSVVFGEGGEFVGFTRLLTTPYVTGLPGGGKSRFQPIWVGDLVPMLADAVESDDHVGKTYEIGGPEVLTLADVARAIYRSEGKSLRVLPVPMILAGIGLTIAGHIPGIPMGRDQYRSLQFDNTADENDVTAFGLRADDLLTLSDYLNGDERTSGSASEYGNGEKRDGAAASP